MNEKGKILILSIPGNHANGDGKLAGILICDRQIIEMEVYRPKKYQIGDIYIGRIDSISPNIDAAFVDLGNGEKAFLPLSEITFLTNRELTGKKNLKEQVKPGDQVLVQYVKEPIKTKLAGVSGSISLAGKYCVVEKDRDADRGIIQVSSKLSKKQHIQYIKDEKLQELSEGFKVTVRTNAGELDTKEALYQEVCELTGELNRIYQKSLTRSCYSCLYAKKEGYIEFIQSKYDTEYDEIVTDIPAIFQNIQKELPKARVRLYEDSMLSLYKLYSIESGIRDLCSSRIWMKSGGYLVVEATEALISVDVNSGKNEKGKNDDDTKLAINKEAARTLAVHLRARNLSGMILVDFISMHSKEKEQELLAYMKALVKKDPVTTRVVDVTGLGLVEITRKKINTSIDKQLQD